MRESSIGGARQRGSSYNGSQNDRPAASNCRTHVNAMTTLSTSRMNSPSNILADLCVLRGEDANSNAKRRYRLIARSSVVLTRAMWFNVMNRASGVVERVALSGEVVLSSARMFKTAFQCS